MKRLAKVLLVVLCIMMLGGCGANKLSSTYSEDKLKAASEEIIKNIADNKFDDVTAKFNADFKKDLPASKLKEGWDSYKKLGKYDSFSKITFQEQKGIAIVIADAKFEKGKAHFTISYNKDMEIVGIYVK